MEAHPDVNQQLLTSTRDIRLYVETTVPPSNPKAVVVVSHGFAEYSGRYDHIRDRLLASSIATLCFDFRGHGRSDGQRGHVLAFDEYLEDLSTVLMSVGDIDLDVPVFLLAHSMGGLVALLFLAEREHDLRGAVISSPFLGFAIKVPAWKAFLGNALSRILPTFSMANGIDARQLSHDPAVVEAYQTDPLVHHVATARWFTETKRAQARALDMAGHIQTPIRLLQGEEDRLVSVDATVRFQERLDSTRCDFTLYPGLYHEIYNEPEGANILDEVVTWISNQAIPNESA